jgi:hypothetical protein
MTAIQRNSKTFWLRIEKRSDLLRNTRKRESLITSLLW